MKLLQVDDQLDKYNMLGRLQLAVFAGIIVIALYSFQFIKPGGFLRIFGVGILAAGGFLLIGFLLGFIFAIPRMAYARSVAGASTASAEEGNSQALTEGDNSRTTATATVETNSNLVEISDWLTKILVGVSLVELNKIPSRLRDLTTYISGGLRSCGDASPSCVESSEAFALGIIVFFFAAGFLIGYLWTRLYLQRALAELSARAERVDKAWENIYQAEMRMRDGALDEANELIDQALRTNPSHPGALLTKGRILKRLAQVKGKPGDTGLLDQALRYVSQAAVLRPTSGAAIYNVACYQALLGKDRAEILRNLRKAFQLNSALKQTARTDEDFVSLREDADFKQLTSDS
jgi:hypothetical protein